MKLEIADLITKEDGKYITLDVVEYAGKNYAFTNKLTNDEDEEPTEEFYVFTIINNKIEKVIDNDLIEKLLPIFQKNIENELKTIMESETN